MKIKFLFEDEGPVIISTQMKDTIVFGYMGELLAGTGKRSENKMIFVTEDTHGGIDVSKLNTKNFLVGKSLTKDDYVIVAGDFGFIWDGI